MGLTDKLLQSLTSTEGTVSVTAGFTTINNEQCAMYVSVKTNISLTQGYFTVKIVGIPSQMRSSFKAGNIISVKMSGPKSINKTVIVDGFIIKTKSEEGGSDDTVIVYGVDKYFRALQKTVINAQWSNQFLSTIISAIGNKAGINTVTSATSEIIPEFSVCGLYADQAIELVARRFGYIWNLRRGTLYFNASSIFGTQNAQIITSDDTMLESSFSYSNDTVHEGKMLEVYLRPGINAGDTVSYLSEGSRPVVYLVESCEHIKTPDLFKTVLHLIPITTTRDEIKYLHRDDELKKIIDEDDRIHRIVDAKTPLLFGEVDQFDTQGLFASFKVGQNGDPTVPASTDAPVGVNGCLMRKSRVSSPMALDNAGWIIPVYEGERFVLYRNNPFTDAVPLASLFTKDMRIPPYQDRDMIWYLPVFSGSLRDSAKNHIWLIDKEANEAISAKSMVIRVGSANLTAARPTTVADGRYQVEADEIHLGGAATKGAARLDDTTVSDITTDSGFWTWFTGFNAALQTFLTGLNPGTLPAQAGVFLTWLTTNPAPSSLAAKINSSSSKTKIE